MKLTRFFPRYPVLSFSFIGASLATCIILTTYKPHPMADDAHATEVMRRLSALQTQLSSLEHTINKPLHEVNVNAITKQLSLLTARLEQLRAVDPETLHLTEKTLSGQLNSIQTVVNHLDKTTTPIQYLKPEALPFKVISLDSIQHIPVASVAYDFKVIPLEKGEMLAGFTLIGLDYGKQRLEFENRKKERILISHEQIG